MAVFLIWVVSPFTFIMILVWLALNLIIHFLGFFSIFIHVSLLLCLFLISWIFFMLPFLSFTNLLTTATILVIALGFVHFETGSHYVAQVGLKLMILLFWSLMCWDYRYEPPCPAIIYIFNSSLFTSTSYTTSYIRILQCLFLPSCPLYYLPYIYFLTVTLLIFLL
jgi:hypothetical protein